MDQEDDGVSQDSPHANTEKETKEVRGLGHLETCTPSGPEEKGEEREEEHFSALAVFGVSRPMGVGGVGGGPASGSGADGRLAKAFVTRSVM